MLSGGLAERDIASIRLPQWGRVVEAEGVVPWLVVDPDGNAVEPVQRFLRDFVARATGPAASAAMPMACCDGGGGWRRRGLGQGDVG